MSRNLKIILSTLLWVGILLYVILSSRLGVRGREAVMVQKLSVTVADSSSIDIVRAPAVEAWVLEAGLWPVGLQMESINTGTISACIESHDFVRSAKTYTSLDGTVSVSVLQRKPIMRFITSSGHNFYITDDGYVVPVRGRSAHYVPVITGNFGLPFDKNFSGELTEPEDVEKKEYKNYIFLSKLINFVNYIGNSEFWSSQIVQINVTEAPHVRTVGANGREPELELIPRAGDHVVLLGRIEGYEDKLDRLMKFYTEGLNREGWKKWNHINLKYDSQIVCSNK